VDKLPSLLDCVQDDVKRRNLLAVLLSAHFTALDSTTSMTVTIIAMLPSDGGNKDLVRPRTME
jgi:hypothetical protein